VRCSGLVELRGLRGRGRGFFGPDGAGSSGRGRGFFGPDGAGRTRPEGRRRPQTTTNLCDVVLLAHAVAIGGNLATGAQRIEIWRGDASHLSSNSAAANPPTAAVRLSCNDRLRPAAMERSSSLTLKWLSTLTRFSTINATAFAWSGRRCSSQERRTAAVGGLAAAEFDDRCDAPPRQVSIRCAPVAKVLHDNSDGEHESVAVVRRCPRPPTTRRTRAPCRIGSEEAPTKTPKTLYQDPEEFARSKPPGAFHAGCGSLEYAGIHKFGL
jgi:hypothetical protein